MFGYMGRFMGEHAKETDIVVFPWEEERVAVMTIEEEQEELQKQKEAEDFFRKWDEKKEAYNKIK